jgi:hypothetical protein
VPLADAPDYTSVKAGEKYHLLKREKISTP